MLQGVVHVAQVVAGLGQPLVVVAGLGQRIDAGRVPGDDAAVGGAADQEVLRLDADVEDVAGLAHVRQDALEVDARAVGMRPAVHVQVGGEAGQAGLPGQRGVAGRVDAGHHVVRGGVLSHAPDGPAREAGADVGHVVQGAGRHHLHLGRPVNVHELDQQVVDAVLLQLRLEGAAVHGYSPIRVTGSA